MDLTEAANGSLIGHGSEPVTGGLTKLGLVVFDRPSFGMGQATAPESVDRIDLERDWSDWVKHEEMRKAKAVGKLLSRQVTGLQRHGQRHYFGHYLLHCGLRWDL